MHRSHEPRHPNTEAEAIAQDLEWFSSAPGLPKLAAPRRIAGDTGLPALIVADAVLGARSALQGGGTTGGGGA